MNLTPQALVFLNLALQVGGGNSGFGVHPFRSQQVDIGCLVMRVLEVLGFDVALFDQGLNAVIDFTQTHTQVLGELALGGVRVLLEELEQFVVGILIYGFDALPPYPIVNLGIS